MKTTLLTLVLLASGILSTDECRAQGNAPPPTPSPALVAALRRVGELTRAADALFNSGKFKEAIPAYRIAIDAERQLTPYSHPGTSYHHLALALEHESRFIEALEAYRSMTYWDPDPHVTMKLNTASFATASLMDHAILLARQGRAQDAKDIYYAGLRELPPLTGREEPVPLLVVFDRDADGEAQGEVWEYTPQRLEAAALMAKAIVTGRYKEEFALAAEAGRLAPGWSLPVAYQAYWDRFAKDRDARFDVAARLAKSDAEREAIAWARSWNRDKIPTDRTNPAELRKGLRVLVEARERLKSPVYRSRIISERPRPARTTEVTKPGR